MIPDTPSTHVRTAVIAVATATLLATPAAALAAEGNGESASGTIKIEETELIDADNPNEVKAGCDFRVDFFGFGDETVPLTFTLEPPAGADDEVGDVVAEREADLEAANGNEPSGFLDVDLTDDLSAYQPAEAEDFDYKLRVDAVVKDSEGGDVTKSANLFLDCEPAATAATTAAADQGDTSQSDGTATDDTTGDTAEDTAADSEEQTPAGGVDAGGRAGDAANPSPMLALGLLLLAGGAWVAARTVHLPSR